MADENLRRDDNKLPVIGGVTSADEIRNILVTEDGKLEIAGTISTGTATIRARLIDVDPQSGYAPWIDTTNATYIFIGEAPEGNGSASATFNIIRIPKATGGVNGKVQLKQAVAWDNRAVDTGWS